MTYLTDITCPFCDFSALSVERIVAGYNNNGSRYARVICNHCGHFITYLDKKSYWQEKTYLKKSRRIESLKIDSS